MKCRRIYTLPLDDLVLVISFVSANYWMFCWLSGCQWHTCLLFNCNHLRGKTIKGGGMMGRDQPETLLCQADPLFLPIIITHLGAFMVGIEPGQLALQVPTLPDYPKECRSCQRALVMMGLDQTHEHNNSFSSNTSNQYQQNKQVFPKQTPPS